MRKTLVSLALAAAIMTSVSVPAFATKKFNMGVFDGKDYVNVIADDMTGISFAFPRFGTIEDGGTYIVLDDGSRVSVSSSLQLTDSADICFLQFTRTSSFPAGLNSVIVKIGDNRYTFFNGQINPVTAGEIVLEEFDIPMKKELTSFMNDLIEHADEEIKVRLVCTSRDYDFILTNDMKAQILVMYGLYIDGGGTRESNMHDITEYDSVIVEKNGKRIQGNVTEKLLRVALEAFVNS